MKYKDYYKILDVPRDATQDDIKRAYRRLARKYHPDVSKETDAEARFKEVNEANEVLRDPKKRATYDALGSNWRAGQEFRPPPGSGFRQDFRFDTDDLGQFSDFFSSIFGGVGVRGAGGGASFRPSRGHGRDQNARVRITLEEAYSGGTRRVRLEAQYPGGEARTLNVRIPAGITSGQKIRLAGQGQPGLTGGARSDLYLEVEIQPHRFYQLDGRDLILHLPVTPWEAALGGTIAVPTPGGTVNLKIPAGSRSGRKLRLKGRGLPGEPPGDEYVVLEIQVPPADSEEAREFYRRMAREMPFDPRAHMTS